MTAGHSDGVGDGDAFGESPGEVVGTVFGQRRVALRLLQHTLHFPVDSSRLSRMTSTASKIDQLPIRSSSRASWPWAFFLSYFES